MTPKRPILHVPKRPNTIAKAVEETCFDAHLTPLVCLTLQRHATVNLDFVRRLTTPKDPE
jgi:hypothetical protein